MTSSRRSTRTHTMKHSYVEVPEDNEDISGDEVSSRVPGRPSKRRRPVVIDSDDDLDEVAVPSSASPVNTTCGRKHATASASTAVASAADWQPYQGVFAASDVPEGETPTGDDDEKDIAEINAELAAGIDVDEESDEEDEFFPGPDPNIEDEIMDESNIYDVSLESEVTDAEVNPDFARKLRIILDALCEWAKGFSFSDYKAIASADRPVTMSTWRILRLVRVDFLLVMYLPAIPLQVQELFLKKEWSLEDFLSLPEVEEDDASDQGLYGNFPTGHLNRAPKIGCECYVGSTVKLLRRIMDHLKISSRHTVSTLPKKSARSLHYRTTCREDVVCNFRKLAQFKRPIHVGYLVLLEGIFMVLFGTFNYPGYYAKWATKSSYELVRDIRALLDVPAIPWKGLNASWPLRQGFIASGPRMQSECCNPACKTMTYPHNMMPAGPKHPRVLANAWNPLGGYLCRRCESYRERRGVLPDNATLHKLVSKYVTETAKSDLRQAGQPVICEN